MAFEQDWHTEEYKGMEVHVTPLAHDDAGTAWDFSVRISQPGEDASYESELTAASGDNGDYPSREAAIEAGFVKGYAIVDSLLAG